MRLQFPTFAVTMIAASTLLAGCSGRGSVLPGGSSPTQAVLGSTVILSGTIVGSGPQLLAHVRRLSGDARHRLSFTFNHILVQGALFPGDAGGNPVTNATTIPVPSNNVYSASVSFSNVPVHNNEWGVLQFTGVAADGSQIALGELAGIINVTSSPANSSTLTETTTQTFQEFLCLSENGALSTFDLDSKATLNATLAADIAATHIMPDPTTHLFTQGEMQTLYNDIAPSFARNGTFTASPATNGSYVLLRDYTNVSELDYVNNLEQFFGLFPLVVPIPKFGLVLGGSTASCGDFITFVPPHSPSTNPMPVPNFVNTCIITGGIGASTIRNIYGGHILIGATNNPYSLLAPVMPPFNGGFTTFPGHAPGTFSATIPTAASQQLIAVSDPAGFAFGAQFYATLPPFLGAFYLQPNFSGPLSAATFIAAIPAPTSRIAIPIPYSATSNKLTVDTFDPWDIATTNMQICGGISCFALNATQPLAIQRLFADAGTKLSFFNWKTGGTATAITQNTTGGYKVTISGAGTATLTTTTASALAPRQRVVISETALPVGAWTLTAKDAASNTYTNSAPASFGSVTIQMDSVGFTVATTQIVISFPTTGAKTVNINSITEQ